MMLLFPFFFILSSIFMRSPAEITFLSMEMPTIKEVPVGQHGHYSFSSAGALRIFMFSFIGAFSTIDKGTQQN